MLTARCIQFSNAGGDLSLLESGRRVRDCGINRAKEHGQNALFPFSFFTADICARRNMWKFRADSTIVSFSELFA